MAEPLAEGFEAYFRALWGRSPFAWQSALARRVTDGSQAWPNAIALPTAAGKTACLDIAVYALAMSARNGKRAARRIFFVVDRRVIVDEAFQRARELARKLEDATAGILKTVADNLRCLAYGEQTDWEREKPLACYQLRGGMFRSEAWARSPLQPMIVASTVDQIGSRLLFRAYGRGPGMWPVFAGLAGNDSLILLDEAHCAQPFLETLQSVVKYRAWAMQSLLTGFQAVVMSATPPAGLTDVFRDTSPEPRDPDHALGKRQLAAKPATLSIAIRAKGKNAPVILAEALKEAAQRIAQGKPLAVVIFCNRVATARATYGLLANSPQADVVLLTGRMRAIDKDDVVGDKLKALAAENSTSRVLMRPFYVVATQTLEVGANLDFDALVTECASLDALRQRFGRLNRMGRPINSQATVVIRADQAEDSEDDPVYGSALGQTWTWLNAHSNDAVIDMGISALNAELPNEDALIPMNASSLAAPIMLPAHVDCWAQTAPAPMPSPDIALFLHGPTRASADVQVCWRADLNLSDEATREKSIDALTLCPPSAAECLPVPIGAFRRWMKGQPVADDSADIEGVEFVPEEGRSEVVQPRWVLRWRGRDDVEAYDDPARVRPGDVLVIAAGTPGWQELGDLPKSPNGQPVFDLGDRANAQARAIALLRLHSAVLAEWPECSAKHVMFGLAQRDQAAFDEDPGGFIGELVDAFRQTAEAPELPEWLKLIARYLARDRQLGRHLEPHPFGGWVVQGSRRMRVTGEDADSFSDEDDTSASGTVRVPLRKHLPGVAEFARRFAAGCGLSPALVDAIERAGLLHDLGKADPRFQVWLAGGNPWAVGELLAKSSGMRQGRRESERARELAKYPKGGRHELLSVRLAESAPELLPADSLLRDLVLHLVASHHGHCRPFAPVVFDEQPLDVKFEFQGLQVVSSTATGLESFASGVPDRFWRLVRHFGWWGLAWLEAILRLADHRRSEWEELNRD